MIVPAICYKDEIEREMNMLLYTDDMMYFVGSISGEPVNLFVEDDGKGDLKCQFAIVDGNSNLVGYLQYRIDLYASCAYDFATISFAKGKPIMGKELHETLERLVRRYHRVEFSAISSNSVIKAYDRFLESHNNIGHKHVFKDAFRDLDGNYNDQYVYEFVNPNVL